MRCRILRTETREKQNPQPKKVKACDYEFKRYGLKLNKKKIKSKNLGAPPLPGNINDKIKNVIKLKSIKKEK